MTTEPTFEEIFYKPWPAPNVPCPPAWCAPTLVVDEVDRECARLMAEAHYASPITRQEFKKAVAQVEAKARRAHG
jgi:hypothetical protein